MRLTRTRNEPDDDSPSSASDTSTAKDPNQEVEAIDQVVQGELAGRSASEGDTILPDQEDDATGAPAAEFPIPPAL